MDEELKKIIEDAQSIGLDEPDIRDIEARYNQKKKGVPVVGMPSGSIEPSETLSEGTESWYNPEKTYNPFDRALATEKVMNELAKIEEETGGDEAVRAERYTPEVIEYLNDNYKKATGYDDQFVSINKDGEVEFDEEARIMFTLSSQEMDEWYKNRMEQEVKRKEEQGALGRTMELFGTSSANLIDGLKFWDAEDNEREAYFRNFLTQASLNTQLADVEFGKDYSELTDEQKAQIEDVKMGGVTKNFEDGNYDSAFAMLYNMGLQQIPQLVMMIAAPELRVFKGLAGMTKATKVGSAAKNVLGAARASKLANYRLPLGSPLLGLSAAGSKYAQIYDNPHLTDNEKVFMAAETGVVELVLESVGAGAERRAARALGRMGLKATQELTTGAIKSASARQLNRALKDIPKSMLTEFGEESLAGLNEVALDKVFLDEDEVNIYEILDQGVVGATVGGGTSVMTAMLKMPSYIGSTRNTVKRDKLLKEIAKDRTLIMSGTIDEATAREVEKRMNRNRDKVLSLDGMDAEMYQNFTEEDLEKTIRLNEEISLLRDNIKFEEEQDNPNKEKIEALSERLVEANLQRRKIEEEYQQVAEEPPTKEPPTQEPPTEEPPTEEPPTEEPPTEEPPTEEPPTEEPPTEEPPTEEPPTEEPPTEEPPTEEPPTEEPPTEEPPTEEPPTEEPPTEEPPTEEPPTEEPPTEEPPVEEEFIEKAQDVKEGDIIDGGSIVTNYYVDRRLNEGESYEVKEVIGGSAHGVRIVLTDGRVAEVLIDEKIKRGRAEKTESYRRREAIASTINQLSDIQEKSVDPETRRARGRGVVTVPSMEPQSLDKLERFVKNLPNEHKRIFKKAIESGGVLRFEANAPRGRVEYEITMGDGTRISFVDSSTGSFFSVRDGDTGRDTFPKASSVPAIIERKGTKSRPFVLEKQFVKTFEKKKKEKLERAEKNTLKDDSKLTESEKQRLSDTRSNATGKLHRAHVFNAPVRVLAKVFPKNSKYYRLVKLLSTQKTLDDHTLLYSTKYGGWYNAFTKKVALNPRNSEIDSVIAHELVHGVTVSTINNVFTSQKQGREYLNEVTKLGEKYKDSGTKEQKAVAKLARLYMEAYNALPEVTKMRIQKNANKKNSEGKWDYNYTYDYGFFNIKEFCSEALSNRDFQQRLNTTPSSEKGKSIFKKLTDIVAELVTALIGVGIVRESVLERAIQTVGDIGTIQSAPIPIKEIRESIARKKRMIKRAQDRVDVHKEDIEMLERTEAPTLREDIGKKEQELEEELVHIEHMKVQLKEMEDEVASRSKGKKKKEDTSLEQIVSNLEGQVESHKAEIRAKEKARQGFYDRGFREGSTKIKPLDAEIKQLNDELSNLENELRMRKKELENQQKKDDSKEEQQVPSPEPEQETPQQAKPDEETGTKETEADRDVQEAEDPLDRKVQQTRLNTIARKPNGRNLVAAIRSVERFLRNMSGFGRVIILSNEEFIAKRNQQAGVDPKKSGMSKGFANFEDGNIYLNESFFTEQGSDVILSDAITTVRHEGAEMALKKYFKESGKDAVKAVDNIVESLRKIASRKSGEDAAKLNKLIEDLNNWREQYESTDRPYEFMAELMSIMADNSMYMQSETGLKRVYDAFVNFIRNAMRRMGFKVEYNRSEVESLMNNISQGLRTGEMSKYFAVEPLQGTAPVVGISDRFTEDNGLTTTPLDTVRDIVFESGKVGEVFSTKPKKKGLSRISVNQVEDIRKFNGLNVVVHQPDGAGVMTVTNQNGDVIFEGQGGMFFPIEFEAFWASTDNAAKDMTKLLNEALAASEDGRVGLSLVRSGDPAKVLSSTNGVEGATRLLIDIVRGSQAPEIGKDGSVLIPVLKRTEKAGFYGEQYGQDVEAAGDYVTYHSQLDFVPEGSVQGQAKVSNPLMIDITGKEIEYKRELSAKFGNKKGDKLSEAIRAKGHDAIVTYQTYKGKKYFGEIVLLKDQRTERSDASKFTVSEERMVSSLIQGKKVKDFPVTEQDMVKILKHAVGGAFNLAGELKGLKALKKQLENQGMQLSGADQTQYDSLNAIFTRAKSLEINPRTGKPKWDKPNMNQELRKQAEKEAVDAANMLSQTFSNPAEAKKLENAQTMQEVLDILVSTKFQPDQSSFQQRKDFVDRVARYLVGGAFSEKETSAEFKMPTKKMRADKIKAERAFLRSISRVRKNTQKTGESLGSFFGAGMYPISQDAKSQAGLMNNLGNVLNEPIIRRMFSFSQDAQSKQTADHMYAVVEFKVDDVEEFKKRKAEGKTDFFTYEDSKHKTYGKQIVVNPKVTSGEISVNVLNKTSHWAENTKIPMLGKSIFNITEQDVFDIKFNKDYLRTGKGKRTKKDLDKDEAKKYNEFLSKYNELKDKEGIQAKTLLMREYLNSVMASTAGVTTEFLKLSDSDFINSVNSEFFPSQIMREKVISSETGLIYRSGAANNIQYNPLYASFKTLLNQLNAPKKLIEQGTDKEIDEFLNKKIDEYKLTLDKRTDKMLNALVNEESPTSVSQKFQVDIKPIEYASPSFVKGAGRVFTVDGGRLEIAKGKETGAYMIMSLNVEKGKRRQGRAEALLTEALKHTKGKLTGMASNDSAVRLNYKLGMRSYYNPSMSLEEVMMKRAESAGGYILMAPPSYIRSVPKEQRQEKKKEKPSRSIASLRSLIEKTSKTVEFGVDLKQKHESGESRMDEEGLSYLNSTLSEESSKLREYINEMEQNPLNKQLEELIESKKELLRQVSDRMGGLVSQNYAVSSMSKKPMEMRIRDFLRSLYRRFFYQDKVAMDALAQTTKHKERVQENAQRKLLKLHDLINKNGVENRDRIATLLSKYLDVQEEFGKDSADVEAVKQEIMQLEGGSEMVEVLEQLRNEIDVMSKELAEEGFIQNMSEELREVIKNNAEEGRYFTTRYRIFEEKGYEPTREAVQNAEQAVFDELLKKEEKKTKGKVSDSVRRSLMEAAQKQVKKLISDAQSVQQGDFLNPEKMNVPSGSFKQRKDLPKYIQDLYGLETNPIKRLQQTVAIVSNIRQKAKMHEMLREGLSTGIISSEEYENLSAKERNRYKQVSSNFSPLNGYYVENTLNEYLRNAPLYDSNNKMLNTYFTLLTGMRMAQTVLNPNTWRKNYLGGLYAMFANGIFMNKKALSDIKNRVVRFSNGEADPEIEELIDEMAKNGITGGSLIKGLLGDVAELYDLDAGNKNNVQRVVNKFARIPQRAAKRYGAVDDYTKLVIYRRNREFFAKAEYGRAYTELSESQQEAVQKLAAERTISNTPSLSRLPQFYRDIMRFGIFGNFLSFKFEALRSFTSIVRNGIADVKKGSELIKAGQGERGSEYLKMGTSNLLGISALATMNTVGYTMLASIVSQIAGLGDDEEDKEKKRQITNLIRRTDVLKSGWLKDANVIPTKIDKDGDVVVFNMSTEDPYDEALNLMNAILGVKEGYEITDFMEQQVEELTDPTMTLGTILEIQRNRNAWGDKIANPDSHWFYQGLQYMGYFGSQYIPSSFRFGKRTIEDYVEEGDNPLVAGAKTMPQMMARNYKFNMPLQMKYALDDEFGVDSDRWDGLSEQEKVHRIQRLDRFREGVLAMEQISEVTGNREMIEKTRELIVKNRSLSKEEKAHLLYGRQAEITPAIDSNKKYEAMRAINNFIHENNIREFKQSDFDNIMSKHKLEGKSVPEDTEMLLNHMKSEINKGFYSEKMRKTYHDFITFYNSVPDRSSREAAQMFYNTFGDLRNKRGYLDGNRLNELQNAINDFAEGKTFRIEKGMIIEYIKLLEEEYPQ